ncbi:hypothetical protein D3C81_500940 [compost metagenome]
MNPTDRKEWLKSLKVGDEVTYSTRFGSDVITKIARITPTGQIRTEDKRVFRNGYCKIDDWESAGLYPVTDDVRRRIHERKIYRKVINTKWDHVSIDKLERIADILYGSGEDETWQNGGKTQ